MWVAVWRSIDTVQCNRHVLSRDSIDNPNCIPIGLCTVRHEPFEVNFSNAMSVHNFIEPMPKKALRRDILRLHITYCNSHNPAVGRVIDMASHGCPPLDTLDMVKHDPSILQITVWLHSPDKVHSRPRAHLGHLEHVDFLQQLSLAWEFVFLHIGPTTLTSQSGYAVNDPLPAQCALRK
jgi:hypothetical protein